MTARGGTVGTPTTARRGVGTTRMTTNLFREEFEEIQSLFTSGPLNLWVISYGITHEVMVIAVFEENFMERKEITLGDCTYFSGALKGKPDHLTISSVFDEEGKEKFTILGNSTQLKIEFHRMTSPVFWRKRFEQENSISS